MKIKGQKYWTTFGLLVLATCIATVSLYTTWRSAEDARSVVAYTPTNLLRLHIIPNSDEQVDQELKVKVRDSILKRLAPEFSTMKTADEALAFVARNQDLVLDVVRAEMKQCVSGPAECRLELGVFEFPDRAYGDVFVPSGKYRALRVVLGSGRGQNWWCVLFPPLCFKDLTTAGDATPAGARPADAVPVMAGKGPTSRQVILVDEESLELVNVEYRFKVVDWLEAKREQVLRALARPKPGITGE